MTRHLSHMPGFGKALRAVGRLGTGLLDLALPPVSPVSGMVQHGHGGLSADEWGQLQFISSPICHACGVPLDLAAGVHAALCGACHAHAPNVGRTRAALVYDDASRIMVLGFKHGGHTDALPLFARWMTLAGQDLWDDANMLVPVPLHPLRRIRRTFNQSALLANHLANSTGIASQPRLLRRVRHTPRQGSRSAQGRQRNVRGAFAMAPDRAGSVRGQGIVLVDDVRTSGATLDACARVLLAAGARHVHAVTLARIVKPVDVPT